MSAMEPRLFFVHVMKTGGSTFRRHVEGQLGADRVYPNAEVDRDLFEANTSVRYLRNLPEDRWNQVDVVSAHLPFFASTVLDKRFVTATILRDPVERTVSHLRNCQRSDPKCHGRSLEEIYDHPFIFPLQIHNHQVRVFALGAADGADSINQPIDIDDEHFDQALDHVRSVHILGLQQRYDEFVDAVHRRFGWQRKVVPDLLVSGPAEVSERLVRRIRKDNEADMEFFEQAKKLHQRVLG